nr:VTT domain-containing protein [Methanobacterium formicicum]
MFSEIINITESFIVANVSWAVFIGCILEQIIVPIPASLIVLSSTFLLLKGTSFSLAAVGTLLLKVVLPASMGITVGSFVYYTLAYKLGEPFIKRTSKYLGVSVEDVKEVEIKFKKSRYDDIFMFLARCFPVIPSIAINLFCGVIRYDLKKIHHHHLSGVRSADIWLGNAGLVLWKYLPGPGGPSIIHR